MRFSSLVALAASCLVFAMQASAQEENEIIVTGSRIDTYGGMPAVVVEKRADFLVQQIQLINDSRAEDMRKKEIYETIRGLLADAAKRPGMAFGYGEGFLIPITTTDYEVPLTSDGKKEDTSKTDIYVKQALGPKDDVNKTIQAIEEFLKKARVAGRTEIEPGGEVGLSMVNPEKYRYEIIGRIAEDAVRLRAAVGQKCTLDLAGLENRVNWERSDIAELTLYIEYNLVLAE